MKHKRLDLANRRLDARISSLESLATQGTLLAGFGYGTLTRGDAEREASLIEAIISCLAALSVGAAVWVVYLSGYAAIRARIAFLMGSDRQAADDAIQVLRETHERARDCFDLSLIALLLCAMALVVANLNHYTAVFVLGIFALFLFDGAKFKQYVDGRLAPWVAMQALAAPAAPRLHRHHLTTAILPPPSPPPPSPRPSPPPPPSCLQALPRLPHRASSWSNAPSIRPERPREALWWPQQLAPQAAPKR